MSFRKKFFLIFFIFSIIFLFFGFDYYRLHLTAYNINQENIRDKESLINLYKRRDFIKGLLILENYDEFKDKQRMLKSKDLDSGLERMNILKDIKQLEELEIRILKLHEKNLKYNKEFFKLYKSEKEIRHIIRDTVYSQGIYDEIKYLGELRYKSKEAIFQYRDQKHFDDWMISIKNLIKSIKDKELLKYTEDYHKISQDITVILLSQNEVKKEISENFKVYNGMLDAADKVVTLLEKEKRISIENINSGLYYKLLGTVFMAVSLLLILGLFIHVQLIKPLEMLKTGTDELSKKNFEHDLKFHKNDEIGQLATHFNTMALTLKNLYQDLDKKVSDRTMDLERSNSKLMKEISEKEKLQEILRKQATTDELTGLLNRRAAYDFLLKEIKKQKEPGDTLTICYLDIDNFKKINDDYGHEEGDRYLKEFSNILKEKLRQEDNLFRMGGDEFVAIFPEMKREDVELIFEKRVLPDMRARLDIDFSYGIFEFSEFTKTNLNQIMKKADERMYKQKIEKKKERLLSQELSFV
ncbi:diguanylate cyclase [uncultured Ilyobacter sp.]|uniref:diguanylate cyclase n=1 Tax=uncultured Ilyobacter sp. TaxID=544433 RepID=UPI0029C71877|nr:diguanylate cyclase [uncultured Ilyobacter sp.]